MSSAEACDDSGSDTSSSASRESIYVRVRHTMVVNWTQQIQKLTQHIDDLEATRDRLQADRTNSSTEIVDMRRKNANMRETNDEVIRDFLNYKRAHEALQGRYRQLETDNRTLKSQLETSESARERLESQVHKMSTENEASKARKRTPVIQISETSFVAIESPGEQQIKSTQTMPQNQQRSNVPVCARIAGPANHTVPKQSNTQKRPTRKIAASKQEVKGPFCHVCKANDHYLSNCKTLNILKFSKHEWIKCLSESTPVLHEKLMRKGVSEVSRYYYRLLDWATKDKQKGATMVKRMCHFCNESGHFTSNCEQGDILNTPRKRWLQRLAENNPGFYQWLEKRSAVAAFYGRCIGRV